MRTIVNKTGRALRVPLPGGKSLFLGPGARGQVSPGALERPAFRKLVEAGEIELLSEEHREFADTERSTRPSRANPGHPANRSPQNKGDR